MTALPGLGLDSRRDIFRHESRKGAAVGAASARQPRRGNVSDDEENIMAKYLLLKHYRGGPAPVWEFPPMDQWTPEDVTAHVQYMRDFIKRLQQTGEYVSGAALAPGGAFVRSDGPGRPPVTDAPWAADKDVIAGWSVIDVASWDRAVQLAAELSAAPGPGGRAIHEWLEVRPFLNG
jgi:hypothetical protein